MTGRGFLVLGATGGIGSSLCSLLVARGASVLAVGRDPEKLARLRAACGVTAIEADARDPEAVEKSVSAAFEQSGSLDGVVNCVGSILLKPAHLTSVEEWQTTIDLNLRTAFLAVKYGAKVMSGRGGSIVLIASAAAQLGLANHEAVAAAKAGVIGLTRSAAATYAARNVRVNCVSPGLVRTPLSARITGSPLAEKASLAMHPLGRLGEPGDVARAIVFLLDPENNWITGQVLGVDGGLGSLKLAPSST
jgi:NAD(P)-dependent dehydrogenase (short-subunit alcohol dehydrogenase family)